MFNWFLKSSEDPQKASLTARGALESVAFLAAFAGISQVDTQNIVTNAGQLVFGIMTAVSAVRFFWGLGRKLLNTWIQR